MAHEVRTEIELDAPVSEVWEVLENVQAFGDWNRIFRFSNVKFKPGGRAVLWAKVGAPFQVPLPVKFEVIEPEQELRWHGGLSGVVHGSHYLKLKALPADRTLLVHGEEFSGLIIDATWKGLSRQLPAAYHAFNKALVRKLSE